MSSVYPPVGLKHVGQADVTHLQALSSHETETAMMSAEMASSS